MRRKARHTTRDTRSSAAVTSAGSAPRSRQCRSKQALHSCSPETSSVYRPPGIAVPQRAQYGAGGGSACGLDCIRPPLPCAEKPGGHSAAASTIIGQLGRQRVLWWLLLRRPSPPCRTPCAVPLACSPLVTPEEWHAANAVGQEHPACWTRVTAEEYLFHSGMVRCADHDRSMFGSQEKGGRRRYRCARKLPMGGRTSHGITAADLEEP